MTGFPLKSFSPLTVENSDEIQRWLNQFGEQNRAAAHDLILRLRFVPTDVYREWLTSTIKEIPESKLAIYAVRKFDRKKTVKLWEATGEATKEAIKARGSEDLVCSVIASLGKLDKKRFHNHPSLKALRRNRINHIVVVDDSIGSGKRTSDYIKVMFKHPSFLSWWSYGKIRFHVVAFARSREAESVIIEGLAGSNHPKRRYPKLMKIKFYSHRIYKTDYFKERWGTQFQRIIDLCESVKAIPKDRRLGYGDKMSNIVFYHSVPNNIPGVLFIKRRNWRPLFPARVLPSWASQLLNLPRPLRAEDKIPTSLANLLQQIKRGVRTKISLSNELGFDIAVIDQLISAARTSGFLTDSHRLTRAGAQVVWEARHSISKPEYHRSIYIPQKWWVDRKTVQPCD